MHRLPRLLVVPMVLLVAAAGGRAWAAAGDLDPTFGTGGKVTTAVGTGTLDGAVGLVVQADGKLVAAGTSFNGFDNDFALVRYNSDGTLDATFGTGGTVTGIFDEGTYEEGKVALKPGDRLVLYTDGITEARSVVGDEFDDTGLLRTLDGCRHLDAQSMVDAIFNDVGAFAGGRLQDDATAMVAAIA